MELDIALPKGQVHLANLKDNLPKIEEYMKSYHESYKMYLDEMTEFYINESDVIEIIKSDAELSVLFNEQMKSELEIFKILRSDLASSFMWW